MLDQTRLAVVARRRIGAALSPLFYRFVEGRVRPGRRAALLSLLETEFWPLEMLVAQQERLLRRLLTHAVRASAWYRERLGAAADLERFGLDDLRRLPILEKSDLQTRLDEIAGSGKSGGGTRQAFSGGSTGTPVRLYQSREYLDWVAAELDRDYLMCEPFRLGMPRAIFWGSDVDSRAHRGVPGTIRDLLVDILWFDAFSLRRDRFADTERRLRAFRPSLVVGYVSSLVEVARELDSPLNGLGAVQTAAEMLTPAQRSVIAQGFGAPVFNRYASREVGSIAHECAAHEGLHVIMENNIVEVVDADGRPLTDPGDEGEVLVTSLRNLATPLIRYRLGDVARLGRAGCACGRAGGRLESVLGRTSDVIVSPSGVLLHGEFFTHLFYNAPVRQFRVDQEATDRLRVRVVPSPDYSDDVRRRVTSLIFAHGDPGFQVSWEVVDDIPYAPSGKFRYTVSHVTRERTGVTAS